MYLSQTDLWKRKLSGFDSMQKSGRRPTFREKDGRQRDDRCVCTARSRHDDKAILMAEDFIGRRCMQSTQSVRWYRSWH
ncbi:hypothetical protein TNCV_2485731 [Trichonephila clavipes]|uniref:Uncharacterized protein n=1 Tax=Trichonephila clavipes TaxID=2585209 RepID=A0A8X6VZP2_TRICX|nr:hypothetical protein TNCV_2485731 [Trichonephila clavipes]